MGSRLCLADMSVEQLIDHAINPPESEELETVPGEAGGGGFQAHVTVTTVSPLSAVKHLNPVRPQPALHDDHASVTCGGKPEVT